MLRQAAESIVLQLEEKIGMVEGLAHKGQLSGIHPRWAHIVILCDF